jgi:hypothetical protein
MAEFDFYGTWKDDWQILSQVVAGTNARLIPDKWYEAKQPEIYTELADELKRELTKKRRVFVSPSDAPLYPQCGLVQQQRGIMSGWYRVEHRELGDSLALTLPSCFEKDGMLWLGGGSLFLAPEYYNHDRAEWGRPSESLKDFYLTVRRILEKNLQRFDAPRSKIWIGSEAKKMLETGAASISDRGV